MSSIDTHLAVAALSAALCALILTSGQLLGQYFATADGYRRCQPSVMGGWAKRTRLRWRWSQFRFETLFEVPEILLVPFQCDQDRERISDMATFEKIECISGSSESRRHTMVDLPDMVNDSDELVSWLGFLDSLHCKELELQRYGCYNHTVAESKTSKNRPSIGPAVHFRKRSWDFMAPDTVRPFAVTTISNIAIMARRLGMTWVEFRPEHGVMRGEGNGHIISSTLSRSFGIMLHYMHVQRSSSKSISSVHTVDQSSKANMYVPRRSADMMGFGLLPRNAALNLPSFRVGTIDDILATLNILDSTRKASRKVTDMRNFLTGKWDAHGIYGFVDLIPLTSPMIRLKHCDIIRLPVPMEHCVGLTCQKEGFIVFHNRLKEYLRDRPSISKQPTWILHQYANLQLQYPEWEAGVPPTEHANDCNLAFLDSVHECWDTTTDYFLTLENTHHLHYYDLMACHISHAVNAWGDAWGNIREGKARDNYGLRDWVAEGAHMYFDYLPNIAADVRQRGFAGDDKVVYEAWFTMMFRAFCWSRCHFLHTEEDGGSRAMILPARYWDSKLPVYID